jgi:hypothetical protein
MGPPEAGDAGQPGDGSRVRWDSDGGPRLGARSPARATLPYRPKRQHRLLGPERSTSSERAPSLGPPSESQRTRRSVGQLPSPGCPASPAIYSATGHDSSGGKKLGGVGGSDRFDSGTIACGLGSGDQLGCNGRNRLRCARAHSDRLGSDCGDRLGRDGGKGCCNVNDGGLRAGSRSNYSEGMLGYGVDKCESENDGWRVGNKVAARMGNFNIKSI